MRRAPVLFFALSTALLAACGVSLEQTAVAPVASVEMQEPAAPLPAEADGRHAYLHRVGDRDYVSLSQHGPEGGLPIRTGTQRHARAIRLLAADPAQVRAILRSLRLPANQRKLWAGEEIVLDAASYDMLQAARGSNKPLFAELKLVGMEK
ncbi:MULTISPECIES: hypothetical protein [unclassified Janthinobacterium]|uniref:hypothetical protein n=1 Tax=unclassified Janthinobacterium TaxID=2610881 RepID=UPI001E2BC7D2|nr:MULTISPECIES: hypothetical protein [unclassified Janthinobacterium]MCC7646240.1 hypothetical protein [Janthinobacterium sp. EB271-G4-3-1]MCC7694713.1 hypothetical protein [Janthinobacterium sp. EB271-G4-3-2]